jgi:hypothetical protein
MTRRLLILLAILAVGLYFAPIRPAQAVRGTPGSSEFGFGARIDLAGQFVEDGIQLANNLQLDWVKVEIPWANLQPVKGSKIDWTPCQAAFQSLAKYKLAVMASITQPPAWALTAQGPDPAATSLFVAQLLQKFGTTIAAVEIFPGANTRQSWGADPNPKAYMKLWQTIRNSLSTNKSQALLVAGGLIPAQTDPAQGQVNDLEFLRGMYAAGAGDGVQVVSLQMPGLTDSPTASQGQKGAYVLRHYEEIRQVMLDNGDEKGILWITSLGVPANLDAFGEGSSSFTQKQADWLSQAFNQLRSQLYIGVAFLNGINPGAGPEGRLSLITLTGDLHPAFRVLRDQIAQNAAGASYPRPGRAKSENLVKGH